MNFRTATDNPEKFHGVITMVALGQTGRPQTAKRAIEQVEQRLSKDRWPEYYDGMQGDMPGSKRGSTRPGASQDIWHFGKYCNMAVVLLTNYLAKNESLISCEKYTLDAATNEKDTSGLFAETEPLFSVRFQPAGWGAAMEEQCSLLHMRWRPSIFVWEVSCKSSRTFGIGRFIFSTSFDSGFHLSCLRIFASFVFRFLGVWIKYWKAKTEHWTS
ncbi:Plant neutral invertase family protein [Prunus dulcis]|uniref:Alkaline/neutral invertase n=1 Tax=Prunus dulcis TaxID=3755 RepID=A0A4Y1RKS3_PRUDU|nr:Plant neutral invertase family protein [Prunus dulcis]